MHSLLVSVGPYLPLVMPLAVWPLISALINYAFYKKTPAEWEAWAMRKPLLAFLVELCRANGWDITKNAKVLQRYAARRAGQLPEEGWDRLPISPAMKAALQNPATRGILEGLLTSRTSERPQDGSTPPAPAPEAG